jgi:protease-4
MRLAPAFGAALLALASACEGRPRATMADPSRNEPRHGPTIAVFDLSDGVPEQPPTGFLGLPSKGASFEDLVGQVELVAQDPHVRGVLVRLGTTRIGLARAMEIGAMLERLGGTLPVWCHADDLANGTMYLVARGCKRVWASPGGTVDAIGLAAELVYFHQLLADQLGLDVDFLQVGKYKGAEEPFTRDGPSPEALASLQSALTDMRSAWLAGIHAARPGIEDAVAEDGPYSAPRAKERRLVDEIGYFDEARTAFEKDVHATRADVRVGSGADRHGGDGLGDALRALAGDSIAGPAQVLVVRAIGAISMDDAGVLGQAAGIVERRLLSTLRRMENDDDVKAVVLRIDSPGGSALASDLLWHQLMRIRAKKPLVVSVGDMAASGGYYLASAGSVIFADEASIVGSIGVVGGKVAAKRALEKFGIHADTIPAKANDPRAASRAAYESLLVPWDDATRVRLLDTMTGIYDLFLARIAEGRGIPAERVAASAEGRIFGGRDGKNRGLVDELGGLADAVVRARTLAGLRPDAPVGVAGESLGFLQDLLQDQPQGGQVRLDAPLHAMAEFKADLRPFVESVAPILAGQQALCALPFGLTVR